MEVIGAVSSVVALVEVTGKLAKGLTHLAQRWHNAPEEINALALATQDLCLKFAYVEQTATDSPTTLVDDVTRSGLTQLVGKAQSVTAELSTLHAKLETYDTTFQKARWAVASNLPSWPSFPKNLTLSPLTAFARYLFAMCPIKS